MERREKVLLVDDDLNLVMLLKLYMQYSFEVLPTIDPTPALNLLKQRKFDMVISDYLMPEMDGLELLEKVEQIQPGTLKVLVSGAPVNRRIEDALSTGKIDLFLPKPLNMIRLVNTLNNLFRLNKTDALQGGMSAASAA